MGPLRPQPALSAFSNALSLSVWTLASVATAHLLVYRVILGVPPAHPHDPPADDLAQSLLSAAWVLVAVSARCARYRPLAQPVAAAWAAALVVGYFSLYDWLRAGWGGEVGHDVFFGEPSYWAGCLTQFVIDALAFWIGASVVRSASRFLRRRSARER